TRDLTPPRLQPPLPGPRQQLVARRGPLAIGRYRVCAQAHRRHIHAIGGAQLRLLLVAPAGAEYSALVEADAHLSEAVAGAAARHGDHVGLNLWVGGHELAHELARSDRHALVDGPDEAARDLDLLVELARQIEIAVDTEAGAGAVRAVLVKYQPLAWHDVEHALRHRCRHEAAVGAAAVAWPAALELRPQAVEHEREGPSRARATLRVAALLAPVCAIGGAPRQRQQVIVENTGLVLPPRAVTIVEVAVVGFRPLAVSRALGRCVARCKPQNGENGGDACK